MKKLLLGSMLAVSALSLSAQQIKNDPATYDVVDGYAIKPLWGWYTALGNQNYGTIGAGSRGMAISKDGTKMYIPLRETNHKGVSVVVYNAATGEKLKTVKIDDAIWKRGTNEAGEEVASEWQANDIAVDDADNVLLWRMSLTAGNENNPPECYAVNLEDGSFKQVLSYPVPGMEGRFDYFDAKGDVVNGTGTILSGTSTGSENEAFGKTVLRWRFVGGQVQPMDDTDQIYIDAYYPAAATSNGTGTRVCIVNDDLFYLDGFNTYATLYNMSDGTIADSFGNIVDEATRTAVSPEATGNNGVAEFNNAGRNFVIYSSSNQLGVIPTALKLSSLNDNMEFSSMKLVYDLPKDGMGNVSVPERTLLPRVKNNETTGLSRIIVYCNRGGAVAYDFGTKEAIEAAYGTGIKALNGSTLEITTAKGQVLLSEVGNIEVYTLDGQKVADKFLATSINLVPGIYIIKATNNSGTVTSKVIVE